MVGSERQEWAKTTGLNKCFKSHLSGMSELNEKREVLETRSLDKRKKSTFFEPFYQILDTTAFCNKSLRSTV
jgi:hypothetical protein